MATRMLQRRGTAAEWAAENPILADGEMGFETDTKIIKMGDGVTTWAELGLPYLTTGGGTMTGPLNLIAPTAPAHAIRKIDLDNLLRGLQDVVIFTSSGSFIKTNYPWLRAVRVRLVGGGGGSGGCGATSTGEMAASGAGGGGGYSEKLILASNLLASEPVTVGAAGAGGAAGQNHGSAGGTSSFGTHCSATGGGFGLYGQGTGGGLIRGGGAHGSGSGGDLNADGGRGNPGQVSAGDRLITATGGSSALGGGGEAGNNSSGTIGRDYGGGGGGATSTPTQAARAGASGAQGIVIVELYA